MRAWLQCFCSAEGSVMGGGFHLVWSRFTRTSCLFVRKYIYMNIYIRCKKNRRLGRLLFKLQYGHVQKLICSFLIKVKCVKKQCYGQVL